MFKVSRFNKCICLFIGVLLFILPTVSLSFADEDAGQSANKQNEVLTEKVQDTELDQVPNEFREEEWEDEDWEDEAWAGDDWEDTAAIADPLEPLNRLFFHFNDKMYYWVLKPVARVYSGLFPEDLQIVVRNFFDNLRTPVRAVNCLLQGKVRESSHEVARFTLNSTVGIFGLGDFAYDILGLRPSFEDLGQTFAFYGAGGGFYINWPFLGPSNFRDSLGMLGDAYMHPIILIDAEWAVIIGAWTFEKVNYTALTLGDYELFTETALDPYTAVKDAYQQYRNGLIKNN